MNKTKIICTLGPSCYSEIILKKMISNGLNVARFNFSHADYDMSKKIISMIRNINQELNKYVSLMLDTKGPEIRTHNFDGDVLINKDSLVRISSKEVLGNNEIFSVTYPNFYNELCVGDFINIDDGYLSLQVIGKDDIKKELITKAQNSHLVKSRRGVNVPGVKLNIPFLSEKDKKDILFAIEQNYDYIAASFVRNSQDIQDIKDILKSKECDNLKIIAKIENQEGIDNIDEILSISDGIMVARGDLGIEIDGTLVPLYQSEIIDKCLQKGKLVIVATQMLESMQKNPRPTKAEISDVFNAVREGTSATMLSGESASGNYPVESVQYMYNINKNAEKFLDYDLFLNYYEPKIWREKFLLGAIELANITNAKAILVNNFLDACIISKFHSAFPVLAVVENIKEASWLSLYFGVTPVLNYNELKEKILDYQIEENQLIEVDVSQIFIK
ncbi:MAG: pyruvate kinase [Pigeon pea little leaf phytoplasma]|uniref:Pyruvate kinase n=1 Tax=Candidatus Phytoplasma fabacearum TaxID=2982628 RepID=A0ABU8ZSI2_9MOLU|nr:pyruvate kinase ['Bituminaria bituminosa' little leaf phytoplasma]MDV3148879.1 pyruvate kinase [Pigeon pea little leaf phytoplasma]MDO7983495.1 pyruvate kinase ['Bituminaria bituminosa' little leaf phytoplasma]MDO8023878.1 pyruvate kinase ['Bituminaria bituminosa' little leaf phytoplasma]MDO8030511.1 pyruvate kinase ['Bituminaria bituminosa' little leaf phytoplasma]MDV3154025.1 pyruvate kinase [Pigeon pea little leaf phytoplasma]